MSTDQPPVVAEGLFDVDPPQLLGATCEACGRTSFPASSRCPECRATDVRTRPLSATGRIHSFTIVRMPVPEYRGPVPFALGLVDLPDDGIRVTTQLVAADLESLAVGDPVEFTLLDVGTAEEPLLTYAYGRTDA